MCAFTRIYQNLSRLGVLIIPALSTWVAQATILPPNQLHLIDDPRLPGNISQQEFEQVIDSVTAFYNPVVEKLGAKLTVHKRWDDTVVNAFAHQSSPSDWHLSFFGGLARRPEITKDGFALVVCHELGHHLGGYPFYGETWAASEGQSDYFATHACARKIWMGQTDENRRARRTADATGKKLCNQVWRDQLERDVCYRIVDAGKSLGSMFAALQNSGAPKVDTPDQSVVSETNPSHPLGQCRLDTYVQGALCAKSVFDGFIAGRRFEDGQNSFGAEVESAKDACFRSAGFGLGTRPTCWFKPQVPVMGAAVSRVALVEVGNGNRAFEAGEKVRVHISVANRSERDNNNIRVGIAAGDSSARVSSVKELNFGMLKSAQEIAHGETFELEVQPNVACGAHVPYSFTVESDHGKYVIPREFRIGKIVDFLVGKAAQDIFLPYREVVNQVLPVNMEGFVSRATLKIVYEHSLGAEFMRGVLIPAGENAEPFPLDFNPGKGRVEETFTFPLADIRAKGKWSLKLLNMSPETTGILKEWQLTLGQYRCGQ